MRAGRPAQSASVIRSRISAGGASRRLERVERRADRPVVVQPPRELILVVAGDLRPVGRDQQSQPGRRRSSHCRPGGAPPRAPIHFSGAGLASSSSSVAPPRLQRPRGSRRCTGRSAVLAFVVEFIDCRLSPRLGDARRAWPPAPSPARGDARSDDRAGAQRRRPACRRMQQIEVLLGDRAPLGHRLKSSTSSQYSRP